jgi:hypothetical protein
VYKVDNVENDLINNKFCVIDRIVINLHLVLQTENNFENININRDEKHLVEQYVEIKKKIREKYFPNTIRQLVATILINTNLVLLFEL